METEIYLKNTILLKWWSCHSGLKSGKAEAINIRRVSALNSVIIEHLFTEFEQLQIQYDVKMKDIYNMIETEFIIAVDPLIL